MDEIGEKQSRTEFMQAFGAVLRDAVPMVQAAPEMGALVGEVLQFVVRTFKGGRQLENVLETTIAKMNEPKPPAPPPPDPEQIKAQSAMQLEQAKQSAMAQTEQFKAQNAQAIEAAKMQHAIELENIKQQAETARAQFRAQLDAETKLQIAAMNAQAAEKPTAQISIDGKDELNSVGEEVRGIAENAASIMSEQNVAIVQAMNSLSEVLGKMNKPKRRELIRGPDGKASGVIEVEIDQ
jgi:hypothetical protein